MVRIIRIAVALTAFFAIPGFVAASGDNAEAAVREATPQGSQHRAIPRESTRMSGHDSGPSL